MIYPYIYRIGVNLILFIVAVIGCK